MFEISSEAEVNITNGNSTENIGRARSALLTGTKCTQVRDRRVREKNVAVFNAKWRTTNYSPKLALWAANYTSVSIFMVSKFNAGPRTWMHSCSKTCFSVWHTKPSLLVLSTVSNWREGAIGRNFNSRGFERLEIVSSQPLTRTGIIHRGLHWAAN